MHFDLKTDDAIIALVGFIARNGHIYEGLNALVTSLSNMHAVSTQGRASSPGENNCTIV